MNKYERELGESEDDALRAGFSLSIEVRGHAGSEGTVLVWLLQGWRRREPRRPGAILAGCYEVGWKGEGQAEETSAQQNRQGGTHTHQKVQSLIRHKRRMDVEICTLVR
jgi:hypothetical protein